MRLHSNHNFLHRLIWYCTIISYPSKSTLSATYGHWKACQWPLEFALSLLCPLLKKGDATIWSNYRGISLLTIASRILSGFQCVKLKPFVNKLIGSYQSGFRPGKSTMDQTLRQILEKTAHKQINTCHLISSSSSILNPLSTLYIGITYTPPCLSLAFLRN